MTYGHGQPPSGWPPPSEPGPGPGSRPAGRRRGPDDGDEPTSEYGSALGTSRTFQPPPPPPVAEAPYRPRRAPGGLPMSGPLGAPAPPAVGPLGPRPSPAPGPPPAASASPSGRASVPVSRPSPHPHPYPHPGAVPPLPNQWGPDPALPLDLPDRRRNPNGRNPNGRGTSGRRGRPGDAPRPPLWLTVVGVVAVAVLAGVCAAGGYIMFTHPDAPSSPAATPSAPPKPGHFLGYAVVARADGQPLADTDQAARQVIDDLVEKYLLGTVIQARVSPKPASAAPSHR